MKKMFYGVIALVLVLAIILIPLLKYNPKNVDNLINQKGAIEEIPGTGEIKEFNITARQWEFMPSEIMVNVGDLVKINLVSEDVTHGFSILSYGINERIIPGEKTKIEFVADKKGKFGFFCNVMCGSGHSGMNGVLIVN